MKLLILSDSHSAFGLMQRFTEYVNPNVIIHLGDYVRDADALSVEYPNIRFLQVAGNCDKYRVSPDYPEVRLETVGGIRILMTHGHLHNVKLYTWKLISEAQKCQADVVLYGHTHQQECFQLEDRLWVMNPGSCSYYGGTAGLIEIEDSAIKTCRVLTQSEVEEADDHRS